MTKKEKKDDLCDYLRRLSMDEPDDEDTANEEVEDEDKLNLTRSQRESVKLSKIVYTATFILSSKSSCHMVNDLRLLFNTRSYVCDIEVAKGVYLKSEKKGRMVLTYNNKLCLKFDNVLYSPNLDDSYLSIPLLVKDGWTIMFEPGGGVAMWKNSAGPKKMMMSNDHYINFEFSL